MQIKNDTTALNIEALNDPQPGDYWSEHFCPYFLIVDVKGDDIYVLSALGGPQSFNRKHEIYARKDIGNTHWTFDPSKAMIVDKAWIEKSVKYDSMDSFVAEASRRVDLIKNWQEYFTMNPYEVPRLTNLIPKPITVPKTKSLVTPWEVRCATEAPKLESEYWTTEFKLKHALAEIKELRDLVSKPKSYNVIDTGEGFEP